MDKYLIWAPWRNVAWTSNNHKRFVRQAIANAKRHGVPIRIFRNDVGDTAELVDYIEVPADFWDITFGEDGA